MKIATLTCPHCGSSDTKYNPVKSYWRCRNDACEETFEGAFPTELHTEGSQLFKSQKIFISYGHDQNTELVKELKTRLEKAGHQIWIDYEQIDKAQDWRYQITKGIRESDRVLSFLSKHSVRDPGVCLDEIGIALSDRHGAIATLLVEPENEVKAPASVSHIQYFNLSNWREKREQGDAVWQTWLDEQGRQILEIIARETGFAGEMDSLKQKLTPLAQHQLLGSLVKQVFVGRDWVFKAIEQWRTGQLNQPLFLVSGGPGMGKSMLAAQLAHYSRLHAVAYHFCRWDSDESRRPHAFICNLAYQLAARNGNYRSTLLWKIDDLNTRKPLHDWTPNDLFSQLICEAGAGAIDGGQINDRMLVVIDALDEAPEIAALLARRFSTLEGQLPPWMCIVATSRPEQQIPESLSTFSSQFPIQESDQNNQADLAAYVETWSAALTTPLPKQLKTALVKRSEGSIYYLVLAREGSLTKKIDLSNPNDLPEGLHGWYERWFDRQFGGQAEQWARAKPLLRVLCACPVPLPLTVANNVLGWRNEEDEEILSPFGALIRWDNKKIQFAHRSFADWLTKTTGPYRINSVEGRIQLGKYLWDRIFLLLNAKSPEFGHFILPKLLIDTETEQRQEIWGKRTKPLLILQQLQNNLAKFHSLKIQQARILLAELTMQVAESQFGLDSIDIAGPKQYLANLLRIEGDYAKAEPLLRQALAIREKIQGTKHIETAKTLNDLAVLIHAKGDYKDAMPYYERSIGIHKELLGSHDQQTATAMLTLANLYEAVGNYAEAERLQYSVLAIRERIFGEKHLATATSRANLGNLLHSMGLYSMAEPLCQSARVIREGTLGLENPDTATSLDNVAALFHAMGNFEESESLQTKALEIRKKILGVDHPSTATSHNNLGAVLRAKGELTKAELHCRRALEIWEKYLGPTHPKTGTSLNNLGMLLHKKQEYESAMSYFKRALAIWERSVGHEHPDTAGCLDNMATTLREQDLIEDAFTYCIKGLEIRKKVLGARHPDTANSLDNLGRLFAARGLMPQAKLYLMEASEIRQASLGLHHPKTVSTLLAIETLA